MDQFKIIFVVSAMPVSAVYRIFCITRPQSYHIRYNTSRVRTALALVILAAILHAGWNLLLKQVEEKYIVTWWSVLFSAVLALPVVLSGGLPQAAVWPYLILSALTEAFYMAALASAYHLSDLSLVYPIARGIAPAFLAVWALTLLNERPTASGALGLALVVGGLMLVDSNELLHRRAEASVRPVGIALALGIALLISIYSILD